MNLNTLLVKGICAHDDQHKAVVPPIYLSSTFAQDGLDEFGKFCYSRGLNPTTDAFETLFAKIEGVKHCISFSSGMAATTAVFHLLKSGDKVLLNNNVYGGTFRYAHNIFADSGIKYELVDGLNLLSENDLTPDVKMIFVETPSNPLLRVTDIKKIVDLAHKKGILVVADNTFLTPYFQKLFDFGVDVVVYSATKYIGGHADVIAGIATTNDEALGEKLRFIKNTLGSNLSPTDAYSLIRGLKTLSVRFDRQMQNTHKIIEFLKSNEAIDAVHYAGSYSDYEDKIQKSQAGDIGALISIELNENYDYKKFVKSLKLFDLAVSLGGVESLVCQPSSMTHESYPAELQEKIGIKPNLLRLAIGVEDINDLIADLANAIKLSKK
ncbi:cystathionine gamma-synthase [Campylobacter mucosalis]|uniref:trans-sulfuration enzyme family protein n=1 Tax=Campylobacter mucosalis TaxID=202 RepID=UPI0004D6AF87|nr:PLP-dependent aspartate aminotransferase family protein [Campylobacter mucosalis]KEA45407.1 cystathionine gamma-synthase [Campylobacter mucosalis]QKF63815.1 cystathionine-beta-lyase [Campylobacter mucosalis]